eukprot:1179352-Prorocentrum_minimum.AAC.2
MWGVECILLAVIGTGGPDHVSDLDSPWKLALPAERGAVALAPGHERDDHCEGNKQTTRPVPIQITRHSRAQSNSHPVIQ